MKFQQFPAIVTYIFNFFLLLLLLCGQVMNAIHSILCNLHVFDCGKKYAIFIVFSAAQIY